MLVRVFSGWEFTPEDFNRADFATEGYRRGVPMTLQERACTSPIWYTPGK